MVWLWWLGGGLFAYLYNTHIVKQSALQSLDAGFLIVHSAALPLANAATNTTTIHNAQFGDIAADSNVDDNYKAMVQALSTTTMSAPEWLVLATSAQSKGYPVLSKSISELGMHLLENGQLPLHQ
jgi:hypothetical protein